MSDINPQPNVEIAPFGWFKLTLTRLVAGVIVLWAAAPLVLGLWYSDPAARGQAGDLFGSVNALFTGLAFAGVFWTMYLQRQQLSMQADQLDLQRKELQLQREEMAASRAELANQVAAQRDLANATALQVAAAAAQMFVEAHKLEFDAARHIPKERAGVIEAIRKQAQYVVDLVDRLNLKLPPPA